MMASEDKCQQCEILREERDKSIDWGSRHFKEWCRLMDRSNDLESCVAGNERLLSLVDKCERQRDWIAEYGVLVQKLTDEIRTLKAAIEACDAKPKSIKAGDIPKSAPEGLRVLADWFGSVRWDTSTGLDVIQIDLRRWADEFEGFPPSTPKAVMPEFKSPTCKGSAILGTACGHCERCDWEARQSSNVRP